MVQPNISVVIVNFNAGSILTRCVKAILKSTVPVKIYISDNKSTDDSLMMLERDLGKLENLVIYKNNANLGFSAGNNAVYSYINTPFILYLNPDCLVKENTIETLQNTMKAYPRAGVIGCLVKNADGSEERACRGLTPTPRRVINHMFRLHKIFPNKPSCSSYYLSEQSLPNKEIEVESISGACMFVRRQAIKAVGLLDENYFLYCEDNDWFYRFFLKQWKIIFTPFTEVIHIKSYSARKVPFRVLWYKARGMWRFHDKFFKDNMSIFTTLIIRLGIIVRYILLNFVVIAKELRLCVNIKKNRVSTEN